MEKVSVKFIRDHEVQIEGRKVLYRANDIVELDKDLALTLFKEGVILPGIQFGKGVRMDG